VIDLEVGFSARSGADHSVLLGQRKYLPRARINQETFDRALEVQGILASRGHHRVAIPDLLIAACAEENELTVVHYDKDFDTISRVTGQPASWVVPRGTVS
jgi:predicted nucleic acid-binding protein